MDLIVIYSILFILFLYYIINYIHGFYVKVKKYPPGPMPIPVLGNLLVILYVLISKRDIDVYTALYKIGHKYGKMFTFWFGSTPAVFILDLDIGKEVFNKYEISDRPQSSIESIVDAKDCKSFVLQEYTREVQYLRKLFIESLRQVQTGNKLSATVNDVMNETVNAMKTRENGKSFSPKYYIESIIIGTLLELTFGERVIFGDSQVSFIAHKYELFNFEGAKCMVTDFMPIMKYFLKTTEESKAEMNKVTEFYKKKYNKNLKNYITGSTNNICDSLLTVRDKLMTDGKESANFLNESNLIGTINSLLAGATDTSIVTMKWLVLLMAYYPDLQTKMRNEINDKIGNRTPEISDKINCDFVNAFISETLRIRNTLPIGLFHKTSDDIAIREYTLPKNTLVFLHHYFILNNRKYWSEPEKFNPNRFIDSNGKFSSAGLPAYIPFGSGRRMCPGDKMANSMSFLVMANLLQKTEGYQVLLANKEKIDDLKPNRVDFLIVPKTYDIILRQN